MFIITCNLEEGTISIRKFHFKTQIFEFLQSNSLRFLKSIFLCFFFTWMKHCPFFYFTSLVFPNQVLKILRDGHIKRTCEYSKIFIMRRELLIELVSLVSCSLLLELFTINKYTEKVPEILFNFLLQKNIHIICNNFDFIFFYVCVDYKKYL